MTVCLTFLSVTAGNPTRSTVFGDGSLSESGLHEARAVEGALPPYSLVIRAPSTRCGQAADTLGLESTPEPALRDFDYGKWCGCTVDEVVAADPCGFSAWLTDPDAAPHGGESVRQLCNRAANWLINVQPDTGSMLAVTEPAIIQALLVHALAAPVHAFRHFDVAPLAPISFTSHSDGWNVRFDRVTPPKVVAR